MLVWERHRAGVVVRERYLGMVGCLLSCQGEDRIRGIARDDRDGGAPGFGPAGDGEGDIGGTGGEVEDRRGSPLGRNQVQKARQMAKHSRCPAEEAIDASDVAQVVGQLARIEDGLVEQLCPVAAGERHPGTRTET